MKKTCIFFFLLFSVNFAIGQDHDAIGADSLKKMIRAAKDDTTKVKLLAMIIDVVGIPDMENYSKQLLVLSDKLLNDKSLIAFRPTAKKCKTTALTGIGFVEDSHGNTVKAIEYYKQSLAMQAEIHDKHGEATNFNNISICYRALGDITKALEFNKQSLKIWEELKDEQNTATCLYNLAGIYKEQNDYGKALDYFKKCLAIFEKTPDSFGIEAALNSIASILIRQGKFKEALGYNLKSLKIAEKHNNNEALATSLNTIGKIYLRFKNIDSTIYYYKNSLTAARKDGDQRALFYIFNNYSDLFLQQKKIMIAHAYADSSASVAEALGFPGMLRYSELMLARVDSAIGNYKSAFAHYKRSIIYKDSVNNEGNRKATVRSQLSYEFDKKEAIIKEQQEKERIVAQEKNRFQQIIIWSVVVGLLLVIIFAVFVFRSLNVTRHQKIIIEEKQKEILDSIHYAKRIQTSLLPTEKYIARQMKRDRK